MLMLIDHHHHHNRSSPPPCNDFFKPHHQNRSSPPPSLCFLQTLIEYHTPQPICITTTDASQHHRRSAAPPMHPNTTADLQHQRRKGSPPIGKKGPLVSPSQNTHTHTRNHSPAPPSPTPRRHHHSTIFASPNSKTPPVKYFYPFEYTLIYGVLQEASLPLIVYIAESHSNSSSGSEVNGLNVSAVLDNIMIKVAYRPSGSFSLRDFHHVFNNLPIDAFLPELNNNAALLFF